MSILKKVERERQLEKIRGKAKGSTRQLGLFGNGNGNGGSKTPEVAAEVLQKLPMPHLLQQQVNRIWRLLPPAAKTADDMSEYLAGPEFSDLWDKEYRTNVDVKENRRKAEAIFDYLLGVADAHDVTVLTLLDEYNVTLEPIHDRRGLTLPSALTGRLRKIVSTPLERAALEAAENGAADTQDMLTLAGVAERHGQTFLAGTIRETPLKEGKGKGKPTRERKPKPPKSSKPFPRTNDDRVYARDVDALIRMHGGVEGALAHVDKLLAGGPGPETRWFNEARNALLQRARKSAPAKHRASELTDMERMLERKGYHPHHAMALRAEGMGPEELAERLRVPPGKPGSLEHSHGFQASSGKPAKAPRARKAPRAKPAAAAPKLHPRERAVLSIMRNAHEDRSPAAYFGQKVEKPYVKKVIAKGLAQLVKQEPVGPEGPVLWARITPAGLRAIEAPEATAPQAPHRQSLHELVAYIKRAHYDARKSGLEQLRKLLTKWPEFAEELERTDPAIAQELRKRVR